MAYMLHAFLCPCVAVARTISQSVQDRDDRTIFTDESEFAYQLCHFFRVDVIMMAGPVLAHYEYCVSAAGPVQLEMNGGWIISRISHHFFKNGPEYAFLQGDRRVRMVP